MTLLNQITYYISRLVAFRISKRGLSLTGLVIMYATMAQFMWWGDIHAATLSKPPSNLGLVAYYSFNEGTGTVAGDGSGNGNTGTTTNISNPSTATSGWTDGKRGKAMNFDGSNDQIIMSPNSSMDFGTENFTISAWVYNRQVSGMFVSKDGSGSTGWNIDCTSSGRFTLEIATAQYFTVGGKCVARVWQHFVAVRTNGATVALYINGVAQSVAVGGSGTFASDVGVVERIGAGFFRNASNPSFFNGLIDDVRVYNRALSANEIATLYNSGAAKIVKTAVTNPITAKLLTSGSGGGASSDVTASFTPSPNALVLAFVYTLADTAQVPTMSGNGLTWDRIFGPFAYTESGTVSVFRAMGAAPSSGAATISYSVTSSSGRWVIIEFANVDTSGTNGSGAIVQTATNVNYGGSSVTATLAAFSSANNVTVGGAFKDTAATAVAGSGFSLLGSAIANARGVHAEWKSANDTSVDMSFTSTSNQYMWAAEIKGKPGETKFSAPSNTGLVGYWSFDDGAGTSATDFSGKNNAGILTNGPTWVDGKRGKALNFDGVDDEINMGAPSALDITGNITISAWIYPISFGGGSRGRIIDKSNGTTDGYNFFVDNSNVTNGLGFAFNAGTQATNSRCDTASNTIQLNKWQHVTLTYTGAALFYVNGIQFSVGSGSCSGTINSVASSFKVGRATIATREFTGLIDDVRIYNRALSASEVQALYNSR